MLSCLVPRFGQEDNIMPSSAKFALQFSSLTSGLPKDDEGQADYCISCPQCHQRLPGLAALKEHLETTHSIVKLENGLPTISTPSPPYHHTEQHHNSHQQPPITSSLSSPSTSANANHVAAGSNGDVIISREGGRSTSPSSSSILGEPYACSPCSASFPNRDLLEKHESLHSPNTLVSCKTCHKTFANVYRLQRHMISHDESALLRKFKCTDCDKAFKFKHHLKEHIRIHSGEKPFACNNCGKRFSHSGSYSSHMTSKKCISMGLKLNNNNSNLSNNNNNNNNVKLEKGMNINAGGQRQRQSMQMGQNYLPPTNAVKGNGAFLPMIPNFNNYLASFQNPFFSAPFIPFSMQRILEMTGANANHLNNPPRTPSTPMQSDPEDMIEEVSEDVAEESKLVMDVKEDEKMDIRVDSPRPHTPVHHEEKNQRENHSPSPIKHEPEVHDVSNDYRPQTPTDIKEEIKDEDKLQCGNCKETFNHPTELVQHEKVLCGSLQFRNRPDVMALNMVANSYMPLASGSEDDTEDRESKVSNDSERKVRVRTAISEEQQSILKEYYATNARPNREEFRVIAQRLMLDPRVVQVWFQNNRSRERKMGNSNGKPLFFNPNSSASESPASHSSTVENDQPLDLSVKKERMTPIHSPRYGIVPQQHDSMSSGDEAMNLSIKSPISLDSLKPFYPYPLPNDFMVRQTPSPSEATHPQRQSRNPYGLGLVTMDRLFQFAPEMARNPLINRGNSLSPGSERRSWRDDDSRISAYENNILGMQSKRPLYSSTAKEQPDSDGQYVCDQCDKAFSKHSSLARHKYEHSGQRPYKCVECPKAFKHKHHLTEHKRLHSGEKPFQCSKCLKRFSHSGSYSQHMNHRYSYCKPYRE